MRDYLSRSAAGAVPLILAALAGQAFIPDTASLSANGGDPVDGYGTVAIADQDAAETMWQNRQWRVNAGLVLDARAASHAIRTHADGDRIRFELRDTVLDRSPRDTPDTRRAELSGSLRGDKRRLRNGVPLWGAMLFRHHAWSDPEGMQALTGGIYGQIHMGSGFGGSPALAFRRDRNGLFVITTRGQHDRKGTVHFARPVSFDSPHDLVYRVVLHPTDGSLHVWLDGEPVLQRDRISVGHANAESYWNIGLYFSGGIAGTVKAEYAGHIYPSSGNLRARVAKPLVWPEER
jgi:hypothetical protein